MESTQRQAARKLLERMAAKLDLEAEARLDDEIHGSHAPIPEHHQHVLLTGATGYLGAFMLRELLDETSARVTCLVRAKDRDEAGQRLQGALESYQIWHPRYAARIRPVPGDLGKPLLGLSDADFDALASEVDTIYHVGAVVNLVFPYSFLRPANVGGTMEVLRLAARGRGTRVQLVSTAGVFLSPDHAGQPAGEDMPVAAQQLRTGYLQSKWVAEKLAIEARPRGLPVAVYRPTFIGWHGRTGIYNPKDFVSGMIAVAVQTQVSPEIDMLADTVAVDYVSRAIVHLARRDDSLGRNFHLCSPHPPHWSQVVELLESLLGTSIRRIPYPAWRTALSEARGSLFYRQFASMLPEADGEDDRSLAGQLTRQRFPEFDCRQTEAGLVGTGLQARALDREVLSPFIDHLRRIQESGLESTVPVQLWTRR